MYDKPTLSELIDAARGHLEAHIIPAIKGDARLYFQTLVAVNVLKIAEREIALHSLHTRAAWSRLNALFYEVASYPEDQQAVEVRLQERDQRLCNAIRAGEYDAPERERALFDHLKALAREGMEVANPKLMATIDEEERTG